MVARHPGNTANSILMGEAVREKFVENSSLKMELDICDVM